MLYFSRIVFLWLLLLWGSTTVFSANYAKVFGSDWTHAKNYAAQHRAEWQSVFTDFGVDASIAEAVVFPELVRYSMWQDEIERAAVSGFYVVGGKDKADFSIGCFQMKPSFAEDIEAEYNRSPLAREFGFVFNVRDDSDARRSRVNRLSTEVGQCRYLAIFMRLMYLRHPQLSSLPPLQQLRFLATAYNRDHKATWAQNLRLQHERHFHTAMLKTRSTKTYCYSDISAAYYQSHHPD